MSTADAINLMINFGMLIISLISLVITLMLIVFNDNKK